MEPDARADGPLPPRRDHSSTGPETRVARMRSRAVADAPPMASFPITGWWMDGTFTKRSVQFD